MSMSARQKIGKTCLLCYQTHKANKIIDKNVDGDDEPHEKKLSDQIFVVFLMRNVLEIPKSFCETLLSKKGNPSEWIFCCPHCSKTVRDLHKGFLELAVIQKKYDLLKQKVKLILECSKTVNTPNFGKTITAHQTDSTNEIRSFIFSARNGDHLLHQDAILCNKQVIKLDPNELLEIKTEDVEVDPVEDETFYDFGEDNHDSFEDKSDISNSKKDDCSQETRKTCKLRQRKSASKKKQIDEDEDSSFSASEEMSGSDSEWECGNEVENIESENSEDEKQKQDEETKTVLPKIKRKARSRKSDHTKNTDRNVETKFSCLECEESFRFVYQLTLHNRNNHGKKYTCGHCDSTFKVPREAKEHCKTAHPTEIPKFRTHKEVKDMNCELCGVVLKAGRKKIHMQKVHTVPKCDICNRMFRSYSRLITHRRGVHFKELNLEPYQCKICQKNFKSPRNVEDHMTAKHTHDYRVFCPICKFGSKDQSTLNIHISRNHTNERPFTCQYCGKRFLTKSETEKHEIVSHTKEYKLYCAICSKGFLFQTRLDHHNLVYHSDAPNPFVCEFCSISFNSKDLLAAHHRGHHYKELNLEPYQCKECGKIFKSGGTQLKRHIISEHTKAYDFACNECGKQYVTQGLLNKHIRVKHKKEANCLCTFCGKAYFSNKSLTSHIQRYHTKEFTHKCTLCPDRGYSDNWGLKRHMKIRHPDLVQETGTS